MFHPNIFDLQYFQELHDRRYHVDIHSLPLMRRIAHLHNHLVKYASSDVKRTQTYPAAVACIFSIANALNFNISNGFGKVEQAVFTLDDVQQVYHVDQMMAQYRIQLGAFAKLVEGFDHVENLDYRARIQGVLMEILSILVQMYKYIDGGSGGVLTTEYLTTIFELKKRHIFFCHYHPEDMTNHPLYASFARYSTYL